MNRIDRRKVRLLVSARALLTLIRQPSVIPTEPRRSRGEWRNLKRPLDSAVAPLGVTGQSAVIPTGATNVVRSGMEESLENITLFIQLDFF